MEIAIIGGGASGLFAAIAAKNESTTVTVYEKEKRVGKKILATGNGCCNMTNINAGENDYHGGDVSFIKGAINRFWVSETLDMFSELGILWKEESEGKVYPYSNNASSVLDVLRRRLDEIGVNTLCDTGIVSIKKEGNTFTLKDNNGNIRIADKVIISTGGKAGASLGSDGSGYTLLKGFGHTITDVSPSLVQIKTETETVRKLKGIKVNAKVTLGDKFRNGEVLFTDYGISGPPVFWLSSYLGDEKEISIDIMPEYDFNEVYNMIKTRCIYQYNTPLEDFFVGMLNKRVGQAILKHVGVEPLSRPANTLTEKEIKQVTSAIKGLKLKIQGKASWNNAQVTKGGAVAGEFDPVTMESKRVKGLYACGEVLDIDGDCGGYNLQWAWSSGYLAGSAASGKG